jgi:NAD(P)-dependent dehydrogenase (short-subunit alcohol dehydrogenase family)
MKIAGNLFIVTGGAGGIGKAVSSDLTSLVALFDVLDEIKGSEAAKPFGDKALYVQVDITDSDSVKKVSLRGRTSYHLCMH